MTDNIEKNDQNEEINDEKANDIEGLDDILSAIADLASDDDGDGELPKDDELIEKPDGHEKVERIEKVEKVEKVEKLEKRTRSDIIYKVEDLVSLRCPLIIKRATMTLDGDVPVLDVKLEYPENATERQSVRQIAILLRIKDADGQPIPTSDGGDSLVRGIKFDGDGLSIGESIELDIRSTLAPSDKVPSVPELSITSAVFDDGRVVDYLHGEFFVRPAPPTPLSKVFRSETIGEIKGKFGQSAEYLPEELSPIVWRCTCGEICQDEVCPACSLARSDVFAYFGDTATMLSPNKKIKKILLYSLIGLGALVLIELCIFGIMLGIKNAASDNDVTTAPPVTTTPPVTVVSDDPTELAKAYMKLGNYRSALDIAVASSLPDEFIKGILNDAVSFHGAKGEYDDALYFAEQIEGYDLVPLCTKAYDAALVSGDYERAWELATKLGDDAKKNDAADSAIGAAIRDNDFDKAMQLALARRAEKIDSVATEAIKYYSNLGDFERALTFAAKASGAEQLAIDIKKDAAKYYLSIGDFDRAIVYAESIGDADLIKNTVEGLSVTALRKNMPAYFSYLSADKKREALAERIAYGRYLAMILEDGSVTYGAGQSYTPDEGVQAVSVSVGDMHTVILLSNGKVMAFGSDLYGQCDVSGWKNIVAISAGANHTVGLTADGKVVAVGRNNAGQTAVSSIKSAVMISAGGRHTLALTSSGKVIACGDDGDGQCSTGFWTDIRSISAGDIHSVGLTSDGKVVAVGCDLTGRCDVGSLSDIISISAGKSATVCVRSDGSVVALGGVIGKGDIDTSGVGDVVRVYAGDFGFVAQRSDGKLISAGYGAPDVSGYNR